MLRERYTDFTVTLPKPRQFIDPDERHHGFKVVVRERRWFNLFFTTLGSPIVTDYADQMYYKVGKFVRYECSDNGPLTIFDTFEHALRFVRMNLTNRDAVMEKRLRDYRIYSCEYIPSTDRLLTCGRGDCLVRPEDHPKGTMYADEVKLIGEIEIPDRSRLNRIFRRRKERMRMADEWTWISPFGNSRIVVM